MRHTHRIVRRMVSTFLECPGVACLLERIKKQKSGYQTMHRRPFRNSMKRQSQRVEASSREGPVEFGACRQGDENQTKYRHLFGVRK